MIDSSLHAYQYITIHSGEDIEEIYEVIEDTLRSTIADDNVIVTIGDLHAKVGEGKYDNIVDQ